MSDFYGVSLVYNNKLVHCEDDKRELPQTVHNPTVQIIACGTWSVASLPVHDDEKASVTLVFPGEFDKWADGPNAHMHSRPGNNDARVHSFLQNQPLVVANISHYLCNSGNFISGTCFIDAIGTEWRNGEAPRITLRLRYENLKLRNGAWASFEDVEKELQAIAKHYSAACEMNFSFVSFARSD
jgi:hypothetical protein